MTSPRARWIRLGILFAIVIALVIAGTATGVRSQFTVGNVRAQAISACPWGLLGFCVAFCIGELLYVPGTVFFVAAILVRCWGSRRANSFGGCSAGSTNIRFGRLPC